MHNKEQYVREHIEEMTPFDITLYTELSIDFIREFKDKVDWNEVHVLLECRQKHNPNWYFDYEGRKENSYMERIGKVIF